MCGSSQMSFPCLLNTELTYLFCFLSELNLRRICLEMDKIAIIHFHVDNVLENSDTRLRIGTLFRKSIKPNSILRLSGWTSWFVHAKGLFECARAIRLVKDQ
jgi:hypothetical protein